ncbi:hypothetical protein DSO57_1033727 [Entomophthora muscae]|uniref:Uncharacterized protein n=1 Tax=Entomophthora muscae TaxID=34485 RepID=A0ACC2TB52_9FUNG|nr:hypothetical protein DSO57_1033727 [Entomophthora muscae]
MLGVKSHMNFKTLALILPIALATTLPKRNRPHLAAREPSPKPGFWDDVGDFFEGFTKPAPANWRAGIYGFRVVPDKS